MLTYTVPGELQEQLRPGQLVAIPYGERLVEGIVWKVGDDQIGEDERNYQLRPIAAILDREPALLPHQMALAEWMADYYVTPLAQIAMMMLPPGLMQRSQVVLHLAKSEQGEGEELSQATSLRLQALIGLLLADGELDVEQLKKMLGARKAKDVLKEALASGLVEREAQLASPLTKKRVKRVVRLVAEGEALAEWRQRTEEKLQRSLPPLMAVPIAPDNVRRRPQKGLPDPWAMPVPADALSLTPQDEEGLLAQRQLAAIDLLLYGSREAGNGNYWVPTRLCKASKLTATQLQSLIREHIVAIEEIEIQRDPLQGRVFPASSPLPLTPAQQHALECILAYPPSRRGGGGADEGRGPLWPPVTEAIAPSRRGGGGADVGRGPLWPPVTEAIAAREDIPRRGGGGADEGQGPLWPPVGVEGSEWQHTTEARRAATRAPSPPNTTPAPTRITESPNPPDVIPPILLHGVTGSGKTEVYLQALAAIIAQGKRGIVLVPEIVLTTQAIARFASRFPGRVAIIHGDLFRGERYDEWRRIRDGEVDVVIGSRSALFAPLPDLGILILDEEHEPAYKQSERRPTYHARETAIMLGRILHIPVVLGSATPAIESFYRAEREMYTLVELPGRIGADLPPVEVIDLRNELHAGNTSIISRRLQSELERVLRTGQQAILFLNRRGAASCVLCRDCGYVAMCDRCDVPLTYHSTERILLCHYCNRQSKILHICPQCGSEGIRYFGLGTEKVMDTIQRTFPAARLLRWDRDTASNHRAHQALLDRFAQREADILVGTQMIAKGLDLPGVTLVGVVSADIALNLPDFAAAERAFTLLTQVAGRAGRGEEAGRVIIQTFNPQHFCIDAASRHDYHEFYAAEIEVRRRYGYPPFRRFVKFTYSHENRRRSQNEALLLRERIDEWIDRLGLTDTDVVGPAPALMERVRNKYHWQMIVRGPDLHPLLRVLDTPGWEVDIDPVSTI